MSSHEISDLVRTAARTLMFAAILAHCTSFAQPTLESSPEREQRLLDEIDKELSLNGPYSEALIEPLTELSFHYEEIGAEVLAEETIQRILTVVRANNGFNSLEQAPVIRRLISREAARANVKASWELGQELVRLALRNPDDIRSAGILRDAGDKRMEVLRRYDAGEFPQEIILGCFYDDTLVQQQAGRRGSQPMITARSLDPADSLLRETRSCAAGDRSRARRSIAESAQRYYLQSASFMRRNGELASNDLREVLMALVRTSYLFTNPGLGAQSLRGLLDYETTHAEAWLPQIEARVQIADWDLLYAGHLGTQFEESAAATYEEAYALLLEHGIAQDSIDEIFAPEVPIVLPSFVTNPLVSEETSQTKGYIDVSFVVTHVGKTTDVEVLNTTGDVPRAVEKDLVHAIKFRRFRPRVTDGRIVDSPPLVLRYYWNG